MFSVLNGSHSFYNFGIALMVSVPMASVGYASGKGHKAHEHGSAQVNIVGEGNVVTIALESPSDGIYGFEHEAKKPEEIKKRDEAIEKLQTNADKIFVFDAALKCKIVTSDIKPFVTESNSDKDSPNSKKHNHKKSGTHSEVHATFKFDCEKPVSGSVLKFAFTPVFKSLKKINVQVLSGEKQSGTVIKNDKGTVSL